MLAKILTKKSRIRETQTLLTDADSRTDTILESFRGRKGGGWGGMIIEWLGSDDVI